MAEQDFYELLAVPPSASPDALKKAFRRLAMQYHPDKHNNDPAATVRFTRIREAYAVLSDPHKRARYNYERYLRLSQHKHKPPIYTAGDALLAAQRLSDAVARQNPYALDRDLLFFQIKELLEEKERWQTHAETRHSLSRLLLPLTAFLTFRQALSIHTLLLDLHASDPDEQSHIRSFSRELRLHFYWNRYKALAVAALALAICLLIYESN